MNYSSPWYCYLFSPQSCIPPIEVYWLGNLTLISLHMIISFLETSVDFVTEQVLFAGSRVLSRMLWCSSQIPLRSRYHLEYHQISLCSDAECCNTPWILHGHKHREASSNTNKTLAHFSCWLLIMRRTEITNHDYKQNIYAMFSYNSHQNSMEELCGLWGKTLEAQERAISSYVEIETQDTFQFSRGERRLGCQRYVTCKGFSTPQSLEWALLREANLNCCLNPAETEQAKLSDAEPLVVILPEWPSAATLTRIQHYLVAFTLQGQTFPASGKEI